MDLPLEHGLITHTLGVISASDGRYHEGRAFLEESLAQLREAGPQPGLLFPLVNLSWTPIVQDDRGQAQIWLWEEAMVLPRTINDQSAIGFVLANLGALARLEADYGRAGALLEESLEQFHRIGDQSGAAQALSQLGNLARVIGKYDQARMCLEESLALRRGIGDRLRIGLALCNLANLAAVEGNFEQAQTLSDSGHAIFQEARDKEAMIWAMHTKVYLAACRTDYAKATELLHEELALWRQWRDSTEQCGLATSLVNLGIVARLQGDYQKSRAQFEASLPPLRAMDSLRCLAVVLNELGNLLMNDQDYTAAGTTFTKSLEYARETLDDRGVAIALERLACHAAAQSDARRATRLAGAASRLRETIGGQMSAECKAEIAHYLRPARESLGEEVFATTWAEGRALTLDAAITEGDSIPEERHRSVTGPSTAE